MNKTENGVEFPAEAYAYVPDPQQPSMWKIRLWETTAKKVTASQVGRAMAAMGKGFRGQKADLPQAAHAAVMAKIRAAWKSVHPSTAAMPAMLREAATAQDFQQIIELVGDAIDEALGVNSDIYPADNGPYELEAVYPDRVVIEKDGRYFEFSYTIDAANEVQLGVAREVIEQFVPVAGSTETPLTEAADCFLEATDEEGRVWDAVLVRAGLARNSDKTFYPDAVLREATPLFEGVRVFAKPDLEHLKVAAGNNVNQIVGWISAAQFVEGKQLDTGHIGGKLNFAAGARALRETITDAWKRGKKDLVGLSIDAYGKAKKATAGAAKRIATAITKVNSVDLIVEPSAGGGLVRLVEAAAQETSEMKLKECMLEAIKTKAPAVYAKIDPEKISDEELETRYAEALVPPAEKKETAAATVTAEQVAETVRMVEARAYLRTAVLTSKLPQPAQEKLLADWAKRERFTEADLDAAIKAERIYVARFSESGKVKVSDAGDIVVEDRSVKVASMLDAFFDPKHKDHRATHSFKECYIEITGDRSVSGQLANCDRTRMAESVGPAFRESLDSTSFSLVLGDSITRRVVAEYNVQSQYDAWRKIASTTPVSDFRTQERTLFGGYGDLPIVLQGDPYTSLASPTDAHNTYAVAKRGGTEDVTLEMIKNDDVGAIRRIPGKLAGTAKRTLGKFVFDFVRTNPLVDDGDNFFSVAHGNLGAVALSAVELAVARRAVLKQTEQDSAERLGIPTKVLMVPFDLEEAAFNIFRQGATWEKTYIETQVHEIVVVWYWTDVTDWAACCDPNDLPGIEIGFLDGQEEPSLFVQDMPNVGSMFSNDKLTYKIRHIYGGNVLPGGWKAFYKEVVAG